MRTVTVAIVALLGLAITFVVPPAAACDSGQWSRSTVVHQEVVGVDSTGVGAYASEKRWDDADGPCDGASYLERCDGTETVPGSTVVGPTPVGSFVVPEVRVVGVVVVPRTTTEPATVPAVATPDGVAPAAATDPACWTTPYDAGAYAGRRGVGTDRDPLDVYRDLRNTCNYALGYTCSRLPPF